ncbi:hypothetical protein ACE6H2_024383 [Prunus campanulata]
MAQIRQMSTIIVRPTSHDHLKQRLIELTPWDLKLSPLDYIQKGLLFRKSVESEQSNSLILHLKATLSQTLNIFYLLAGTLAAAADGILDPVYIPDDIVSSLFSMNGVLNYEGVPKPLLAVQVTELIDGIFIGCTMNHCVVDGSSFWHFFNTWSEISRSGSDEIFQPPPVFDRQFLDGVVDLPIHIPFSDSKIPDKLNPPISLNYLQRVFHFSKEKTAQLKSKANAEMGTHNISSLQALMAHLWRAVTRASHLNLDQEIIYKIAVGLRQKLKPPLPKEYLGNALQGVHVKSIAGELLQHELGWAALHINKTIASLTAEQVMKVLEDWAKPYRSSPRFNVYGNDFGWGRPVAVRSGSANKMNGKLTEHVFPGAEEGSIDFEVCLLPETLHAMAEDAEFVEAVLT